MTNYCIYICSLPGYIHTQCFAEVAECLNDALIALGHNSHIATSQPFGDARLIILGAHLLDTYNYIPPCSVIWNLEQLEAMPPQYINLLRYCEVWDYSLVNLAKFAEHGIKAKHLPVGYMPCLERIPEVEIDIDILFIGSINPRRAKILNELKECGLKVESLFGIYGKERDNIIARAKIVLNIHYYESKIFEMVRCSYLMANKKFIISEEGNGGDEYARVIGFVPYAGLVQACILFLDRPVARRVCAKRAYDVFSKQSQAEFLKAVL